MAEIKSFIGAISSRVLYGYIRKNLKVCMLRKLQIQLETWGLVTNIGYSNLHSVLKSKSFSGFFLIYMFHPFYLFPIVVCV